MAAHNRLVRHFRVARWIMAQEKLWTKKELALVFDVSLPTARDWVHGAVKAGVAEPVGKRSHTMMYRRKE